MQYCCIALMWPWSNTMAMPWVFTDSWVAVYFTLKLAVDSLYNITEALSSLMAAIL